MLGDPLHHLPTIGPIDPDEPQLFTGTAEPRQEEPSPCGVGHGSRRHQDGQQEPERIDQHMPFAPFDVFAFVVAAFASQLGGLDTLAVETARRRVLVAVRLLADLGAQGVVEALPGSTVAPLTEIPVYTGPFGIFMGQHPPLDAPVDDIKEGIDHRSHLQLAGAPTWLGGGSKSLIRSHSASVRSVGYGLAFIPTVYRTDATYGRLFKQPLRFPY